MEGNVRADPVEPVLADKTALDQNAQLEELPVIFSDGVSGHPDLLGDVRAGCPQRRHALGRDPDPPQDHVLLARGEFLALSDRLDPGLVDLDVLVREGVGRIGDGLG
nr:hypothetical protein [Streptomyces hygroscopicus]